MDIVTLAFYILVLCLIAIIILYFVGLGLLSKAMFTLENCGCTTTNIVNEGQEAVAGNFAAPVITSITPVDAGDKINLNSTEVNICKMTIVLTWIFAILLLPALFPAAVVFFPSLPLLILYYVGLGYLTKAIFGLGDCGCTITNILSPANAGASVVLGGAPPQSAPLVAAHPVVTSITQLSSYRINNFSTAELGITKMTVILTWFVVIALFVALFLLIKSY
jgi:hypothetical protein